METVSENACFGGVQGVYTHVSAATGCDMTFAVFVPPQAKNGQRKRGGGATPWPSPTTTSQASGFP